MTIIGKEIPSFKLQAYKKPELIEVTKESALGKWGIYMFYPADFTFVCPTELQDMQDQYAKLKELGAEVYSVSTDSEFVHKAWADASPSIGSVEYTMLSDQLHELADFFGVYDASSGRAFRGTFIVDPQGIVQTAEIHNMGIGRDAAESVRKLQAAQFVAENGDKVCPARWKPGKETLIPGIELIGNL